MSKNTRAIIGGIAAAAVALWLLSVSPWLFLVFVVGVPVVGWLMLDPSQRKRILGRNRKQLGP